MNYERQAIDAAKSPYFARVQESAAEMRRARFRAESAKDDAERAKHEEAAAALSRLGMGRARRIGLVWSRRHTPAGVEPLEEAVAVRLWQAACHMATQQVSRVTVRAYYYPSSGPGIGNPSHCLEGGFDAVHVGIGKALMHASAAGLVVIEALDLDGKLIRRFALPGHDPYSGYAAGIPLAEYLGSSEWPSPSGAL